MSEATRQLTLDVPEDIAIIFEAAAEKAGMSLPNYMRVCMLTGVAEQLRRSGHADLANMVADHAAMVARQEPGARVQPVTIVAPDKAFYS